MSEYTKITERTYSSKLASDRDKEWFRDFRTRAIDNGEPYIVADGAAPLEIAHMMDIPAVSTVWYAAIISAKKLSGTYFDLADSLGYHSGLPRYVSLPLFSTLHGDPEVAPYGGLPKPALVLSRFRGDFSQRIFSQWADAFGAPHYGIDASSVTHTTGQWWVENQHNWEQYFGTERLDFQVEQLKGLISVLETLTGRRFNESELDRQMGLTNELGEAIERSAAIIKAAPRLPVTLKDQLPNMMTPTWHRGEQWAVDHVDTYADELQTRVDNKMAVLPDERIRLMWLNNGLWFDTDFYRAFEERYGAVFVWSMYTDFIADGYRRYYDSDPLRALAARHLTVNEQLHLPGWMNNQVVQKARDYRIDAAVLLVSGVDRVQSTAAHFSRLALERIGIPVHVIEANTVDERQWDRAAQIAGVERFLEERVLSGEKFGNGASA